jgi:transketolase
MAEAEMRAVYAQTLIDLARNDERIMVLEADLMRATGTGSFKELFPERLINVGVAEANMIGVASGLSASGKIPFVATFGCFASRRVFDQFFISCNYARLNVKLVGTDPGITAGFNGGTHMPFEDLGLMRIIPGLVVCEPSDSISLEALVKEQASHQGSTYMRLHRKPVPRIYPEGTVFELGKGKLLKEGNDVLIIALGSVMVQEALKASEILAKEGIGATIIDALSLKPLDEELILKHARKVKVVITAENHQVNNGLGSAVAELLCEKHPMPLRRVGVQGVFGEVGTPEYLLKRFGLDAETIVKTSRNALNS